MSYEHIEFSISGGVAKLTLARPSALNALSRPLLRELLHAIEAASRERDARALLLLAQGRAFSSGADLSSGNSPAGGADFDAGAVLEEYYNPLIAKLFALELPVVAGVQGAAAGAGCMLALCADIVVASRSAFFLQAFANVGLTPDAGSTWLLPRLVGRARALSMMMLADRIPAEKALQWGLIHDVVDDEVLEQSAASIAERLAAGPTRALALIRRGVHAAMDVPLQTALRFERQAQRAAGQSPDFREGVAAFREKRKPRFTGR